MERQLRIVVLVAVLAGPVAVAAQDAGELRIAREVLTRLQPVSFEKKREYCGYIGYDAQGVMIASPPVMGTKDSCAAPFPRNLAITASYHTHGDVSTPGGRLWFIDTQVMVARQVCGVACLPVADRFRKGAKGDVAQSYTFEALIEALQN